VTAEQPLLLDITDDGIAWLTLNRPHVLNAMNMAVRDALWDALSAIVLDDDIRVVVFRGAGDRAFSAGADISEFGTAPSYVASRRARHERDIWGALTRVTKPLVASIHGFAYGAGCELALFCDIRIAAEDARFALPEVALGYIPSAGGTQTLPRNIPPGVARELVYTGDPIDARRALALGLVGRVVPRERLAAETLAVARALAARPPAALRATKDAMLRSFELRLGDGLRAEQAITARLAVR